MAKVKDVIDVALKRVGKTEYPPGSNNIDCNTWYYGHEVNGSAYPWCCVEMNYDFFLANASNLITRTASTTAMAKWFNSNGRFCSTPQKGALVIFNFRTPTAWGDHIGLVTDVLPDGKVKTVEGNTSSGNGGSQDNGGCVAIKTRKSNIVGYCIPTFSDAKPITRITIKQGSKGADVYYLQSVLSVLGYTVGKVDGSFGPKTKSAFMEWQHDTFADPAEWDGICGPKSWALLR